MPKMTVTEYARLAGVSRQSVLDRIKNGSLIARKDHPTDSRAYMVRVPAGKRPSKARQAREEKGYSYLMAEEMRKADR